MSREKLEGPSPALEGAPFDRRPKDGCERGECGQVKRKIGTARPRTGRLFDEGSGTAASAASAGMSSEKSERLSPALEGALFDRRPKDGCERGECGQVKRKIGTAKPLQSYAIA